MYMYVHYTHTLSLFNRVSSHRSDGVTLWVWSKIKVEKNNNKKKLMAPVQELWQKQHYLHKSL